MFKSHLIKKIFIALTGSLVILLTSGCDGYIYSKGEIQEKIDRAYQSGFDEGYTQGYEIGRSDGIDEVKDNPEYYFK